MKSSFTLSVDSSGKIRNRESEHREFKQSFDLSHLWKYAKTMAAFSNRDGGFLIFGVKNSPREVLGQDSNIIDEMRLGQFIRNHFDPDIPFEIEEKEYLGKILVGFRVVKSEKRPIICKLRKTAKDNKNRDQEVLREGAIYYRYGSENLEVKYPELRSILDDELQKVFQALVHNIELVQKVGYQKAAILDATELSGTDRTANVFITKEAAKHLNWIHKGRFSETEDQSEKAFFVTKEVEIRKGVEVAIPLPPSETHPITTKRELCSKVNISQNYIDGVLWKLDLLNNDEYHLSGQRGNSRWHQFTELVPLIILENYPISQNGRQNNLRLLASEYKTWKQEIGDA